MPHLFCARFHAIFLHVKKLAFSAGCNNNFSPVLGILERDFFTDPL
jgi:hypothetical protein